MRILNLSRVSFNEVHKFGVLMVFQKCDFTETGAPEPACLQFVAENVKPNSLPVQLNKNLILTYFSKADYYFLIVKLSMGVFSQIAKQRFATSVMKVL